MSGFVIGFGSTEQAFEEAEESAIREHIAMRYNALGLDYITDAFAEEIRDWLNARAKELQRLDQSYRKAESYPDRYSQYWPTVLSDANHIVVILSIIHTNRRHALSPDGWACMKTKRLFDVTSLEIDDCAPLQAGCR